MDQLDPDTGLETSSPVQELVEAIRLHKFTLKNLEHALNRVSHKADTLAGSNVVHAPEFTDPFLPPFPIAFDPSQNPAHDNWGLGDEPRRRALATTSPPHLFGEVSNLASPPPSTPRAGLNCEDASWRRDLSEFEKPHPLGISNSFHPQQVSANPAASPWTLSDPYSLPNETPVPAAHPEGVWTAPTPPPPEVKTFPPPSVIPCNDANAHGLCGVGNCNAANDNFPHIRAVERTSIPVSQMAEFSAGIVFVEPEGVLNGIKSESHSPAASSSSGGYNRVKNNEVRILRFQEIRQVLGIDWTKDELFTLQTAITLLGGEVPDVEGGRRYKKRAIRAYFERLQRIVGPHTEKIAFNKVLGNVLAKLTPQVGAPPRDNGSPYGTFRLNGE